MKEVATIILNRNLPKVTDKLCEHLEKYDGNLTDIYIIEAGSEKDKLSKYATWYVDDDEVIKNGLRYSRGMNYGLKELLKEGKFENYRAFFLLTNDTEFEKVPTIKILLEILEEHNKVGILSPCSKRWGEKLLLEDEPTKYFWFIHNNSYLIRRTFIEDIFDKGSATIMSFLFDGSNFRGYCNEHELIAKAYVNDWAAAITSKVWTQENEGYLLDYADQIKTEKYEENLKLYVAEGKAWLRKKYGFKSKWSMVQYVKSFYDEFFQFNPELNKYKL